MKRVGHLYEQICDIENIRLAIHKASKGKTQKRQVRRVLQREDYYAHKIQQMLLSEQIQLSDNHVVEILDHCCRKKRVITVPRFYPDQIVHWALMLVIIPIVQKGMYAHTCGSVPGRGGNAARKYVERSLRKPDAKYVAKLDISKFFPNAKPKYLYNACERKIKDCKTLNLIKAILDNGGDCLPIGYYTSQWFANLYLEGLDHFIKERLHIKYYVRYVDDMVLIDDDKGKLHRAITEINSYLDTIGLTLKSNYQVWKVDSRPIDFVGFKFYSTHTLLRKRIYLRIRRRVRKIRKTHFITLRQARGLLSLVGWLHFINNGYDIYRRHVYPYVRKKQLCSIVSTHQLKRNKNR